MLEIILIIGAAAIIAWGFSDWLITEDDEESQLVALERMDDDWLSGFHERQRNDN